MSTRLSIIVIAGHKNPQAADTPSQIQVTQRYLTDARPLLESCQRADVFPPA
jgi:hypothetical protein